MVVLSPQQFAAQLLAAAVRTNVAVTAVVTRGARNVKTEGRNNAIASAPTRNAGAPYAITYDVDNQGTSVSAEIGYDKDLPGGALGNLLEFGGGRDYSPPHRDLGRALDDEEPRFISAMEQIGDVVIQ